eukprot:504811-Hanusia_phi.AAC.2
MAVPAAMAGTDQVLEEARGVAQHGLQAQRAAVQELGVPALRRLGRRRVVELDSLPERRRPQLAERHVIHGRVEGVSRMGGDLDHVLDPVPVRSSHPHDQAAVCWVRPLQRAGDTRQDRARADQAREAGRVCCRKPVGEEPVSGAVGRHGCGMQPLQHRHVEVCEGLVARAGQEVAEELLVPP